MKISGIIFDKDGTLFDFNKTWEEWAKILLINTADGDINKANKLGSLIGYDYSARKFESNSVVIAGTPYQIAQKLIKELPKMNIDQLVDQMNRLAETIEAREATPLITLLTKLKKNKIKLGVATNDGITPAMSHLKSASILKLFDLVLGSDSGFGFKPNPGMLNEFCRRLNLDPREVFMVGDSAHDLQAGISAKMPTIGVLTGVAKTSELQKYTDIILNDIGEIPNFLIQNNFKFNN